MTDDRDPVLQNLFEAAEQRFDNEAFVADVMSQIDRMRRRSIIGWLCVGLALIPCAGLLAMLFQDILLVLAQVLPLTLIETEVEWFAQALAPVNTIGALVAFGFLGLRAAYRRIFA